MYIENDIKKLLTYHCEFYFINSVRNTGKTSAFIKRAIYRFLKYGRTTIWLRRFKNEYKTCKNKFFKKWIVDTMRKQYKNLFKSVLDFRVIGNKGQVLKASKNGNKWHNFIEFMYLSQSQEYKSGDDDTTDTIIFDEYTTSQHRYKRYRGNEVNDLLDLYISAKREKPYFKVFFIGNKETINNPYLSYWNIKPFKTDFTGFKTYNDNTILVYQLATQLKKEQEQQKQDDKLKKLFNGTPYLNYYFKGNAKTINNIAFKRYKMRQQDLFVMCDIDGKFSIYKFKDGIYISSIFDKTKQVIVNEHKNYKKEYLIKSNDKPFLKNIIGYYKINKVWYENEIVYESFINLLTCLNAI